MREHLMAAGGDEYVILDSHSADARKINARLNSYDHARLQPFGETVFDPRILVDVQSDAVS